MKLGITSVIVRHKTFIRLISTILLVAIGIFVFYGWTVLQRSREQTDNQIEQYYADAADQLKAGFIDQFPIMISTARSFQQEQNINQQWLESQFYNFILLIGELDEYCKSVWIADEVYLIPRGASYVLSSEYKYDADFFFNRFADAGGPLETELRDAVYVNPVTELTILSGFANGVGRLYIAVPFTTGRAVMLFALTEDSIRRFFMGVITDTNLGLMVYNSDKVIQFRSNMIPAELIDDSAYTSFLNRHSESDTLQINQDKYIVAQSVAHKYGLTFVVIQKQPLINRSLDRFYRYMLQINVLFLDY